MRAPGEPQAVFAIESHIDCIARQLGRDPLDFRLQNLLEAGAETPIGTRYQGIRAQETLEAAVAAAGYRTPKAPNVGRGIAMGERPPAGGESHAAVTLNPDGSVLVHTSIFEPGTGTYTLLQQIVAEELHVPLESIRVQVWDTDGVPFDTGVGGSRVTRVAGQAAYQAAHEASREMCMAAAELLAWPEEAVTLRGADIAGSADKARSGRREAPSAARCDRLALVSSRRRIEPCVRFSLTRLTDILHRVACTAPGRMVPTSRRGTRSRRRASSPRPSFSGRWALCFLPRKRATRSNA